MNNITWGDNKATSYYETVAGGAGAVSCFHLQRKTTWNSHSNINERDLVGMDDPVFIHIWPILVSLILKFSKNGKNDFSQQFSFVFSIRFPVVLSKFNLRSGSGGKGQYNGGDGVDRRILFRRPLTLSILTERRVHQPYGLSGGNNGQSGKNLLQRLDGRMINLGGKCSVTMQAGVIENISIIAQKRISLLI